MNVDLAETLEALHRNSFGWALHCCRGDAARADDVLQNAYLKVLEANRPPDDRLRASFKTWWFGVIRLTAMEDHRRSQSWRSLLKRLWGRGDDGSTTSTQPPSVERDEQNDLLRRCLARLSPRQAEVLHLVFYQDLTLSEAAAVMDVGVGSVRQHYDRGKTRLRELLESETSHAHSS